MRRYRQLSKTQRQLIYSLKKAGLGVRAIARRLRRDPGTICRELTRNRGLRGYRPRQAQRLARTRRKACVRTRITGAQWRLVDRRLRQGWSPEQVSGRLALKSVRVSTEWIYRRVYADKRQGGDLWTHLRCQKQRRKRYGRYDRRGKLPGRVGIEKRPAVVARRARFGDWEADTLIGRRQRSPVVVTLVERKSKLLRIRRAHRCTAKAVGSAAIQALRKVGRVRTVTADNGREFAGHARISRALGASFYFANPYRAWERGLNENTNGLLRQYLPKGSDFGALHAAQLRRVERLLNHRPRKTLGFLTPQEVFSRRSGVALRS